MTIRLNHFKTRVVRYPLLAMTALATAIAIGRDFDLSKSDWSNWVQAVGSITALGVAIFVMSRQNKHARELIYDAEKLVILRRAAVVNVILIRAKLQFMHTHDLVVQAAPLTAALLAAKKIELEKSAARLLEMRNTILTVPAYELGSANMADGLLRFLDLISLSDDLATRVIADPSLIGNSASKNASESILRMVQTAYETFDLGRMTLV